MSNKSFQYFFFSLNVQTPGSSIDFDVIGIIFIITVSQSVAGIEWVEEDSSGVEG